MPVKKLPMWQVDAFSNGPFTGNPAAVCPLEEWLPDRVMLGIAAENNLSETAFFVRRGDGSFDLRWFTPTVEVKLCGHATLASGYVVTRWIEPGSDSVTFHTKSGELRVERAGERLALDFPSKRPVKSDGPAPLDRLEQALGARPVETFDAGLSVAVFDSEETVRSLRPDFAAMARLGLKWVSVTAPASDADTDFVSRYFAPGSGIDEDPVTGSAHTWLTPLWAERLGKRRLAARQVSARGGWLWCEDRGDRVSIAGHVSEYLEGTVTVEVE
jgi:PhzF family phenazine biosynthesis protein